MNDPEYNEQINNILNLFTLIDNNVLNIISDIDQLTALHSKLINNSDKKNRFYNYGIYIDDIYFQKKILEKEMNFIKDIHEMCRRKLYGDLFRLYIKIIKLLSNIRKETSKNDSISKEYLQNIKIYYEIDQKSQYSIEDILNIYKKINEKIIEISNYISDINKSVSQICEKNNDGYSLQMYIIGLRGEKTSIETEHTNFKTVLEGIIEINRNILEKYVQRSKNISNEIDDNTSSTNSIEMSHK